MDRRLISRKIFGLLVWETWSFREVNESKMLAGKNSAKLVASQDSGNFIELRECRDYDFDGRTIHFLEKQHAEQNLQSHRDGAVYRNVTDIYCTLVVCAGQTGESADRRRQTFRKR